LRVWLLPSGVTSAAGKKMKTERRMDGTIIPKTLITCHKTTIKLSPILLHVRDDHALSTTTTIIINNQQRHTPSREVFRFLHSIILSFVAALALFEFFYLQHSDQIEENCRKSLILSVVVSNVRPSVLHQTS
jgi:hypothetical protein